MEKDDKLIRELLKEGLLTKAPDQFTDNVMMAVAKAELDKKQVVDYSYLAYPSSILGAFAVSIGILYFTDKQLLIDYYNYFLGFVSGTLSFIAGVFTNFNDAFSALPGSGLIAGIGLIMLALLAFDRFLFKGRGYVNIFVW